MTQSLATFRITAEQVRLLSVHLLKTDGFESVSIGVCGIHQSERQIIYTLHDIYNVPDIECSLRSPSTVRWPVELAIPFFQKALRRRMAFFKIHSHPTGHASFSIRDDESDSILSRALREMADDETHYVSAFMLPDRTLCMRHYTEAGEHRGVDRITIVGDNVRFALMRSPTEADPVSNDETCLRTRQAFGVGTTNILRGLKIGVVGCSGTGSWVVEMLARLGIGELILVDPDVVERKNLNRIVNSKEQHAVDGTYKTNVLKDAVQQFGFATKVSSFHTDLDSSATVLALAECDFLFGCVDSADGRDALNRIATYYIIPYIDVGVRLDADGEGGVRQITAAIHFLIPGGSSLLTRGVITADQVADQSLRRTHPDRFDALQAEGYVHGAAVDSPAVISINGFAASHAVNELLARLHPFRHDDNSEFRHQAFSLVDAVWTQVPDNYEGNDYLATKVGRGDCKPLIDNPAIV